MMCKVAFVMCSTSMTSGSSKAFLALLSGLIKSGVSPVVITPNSDGISDYLKSVGVKVYALHYRPNSYPDHDNLKNRILFVPRLVARLCLNYISSLKLDKILKRESVSLVHTNSSIINIGYLSANRLHMPHIYHIREYADKVGFCLFPTMDSYRKCLLRDNNYSICITKGISEYYRLNPTKSSVVYDGVMPVRHNMPNSPKNRHILYAGRLEYNKGLHILLSAYNSVMRSYGQNIPKLLVAGASSDLEYLSKIKQYIRDNSLIDFVEFLGEVSDLESYMQKSMVIVVPSLFEGFGFCLTEAMFCGCLTIGHNTTGTKEQFDNGLELKGREIGFRYSNDEELSRILMQIISSSPSEFDAMRNDAFSVVNQLYSVESCVEHVISIYKQILHD